MDLGVTGGGSPARDSYRTGVMECKRTSRIYIPAPVVEIVSMV